MPWTSSSDRGNKVTAHPPLIQSYIHFYLFGENLKEFWKNMKEFKQKSERISGNWRNSEEILKELWRIFERISKMIQNNFERISKIIWKNFGKFWKNFELYCLKLKRIVRWKNVGVPLACLLKNTTNVQMKWFKRCSKKFGIFINKNSQCSNAN